MAGFNALSECEKRLFGFLATAAETDFYWDYDSYYKDDPEQEAGMFVRSNVAQFPPRTELRYDNMRGEKQIVSVAAVSNAVQCKYAAAILADLARRRREEDSGIAAGARPALGKETAVVLTDENLLLPLLYALPADIGRVNVTMGFPLRQSLAYTFVERLVELQNHRRRKGDGCTFYHADVAGILAHPYVAECDAALTRTMHEEIVRDRRISVDAAWLGRNELLKRIFTPAATWRELSDYMLDVVAAVARQPYEGDDARQRVEFLAVIAEQVTKLRNSLDECDIDLTAEVYTSLLRRHLQPLRIPFEGEPLEGIQIMGILETRNLDFENVIILSMNDDNFPGNHMAQASFIPYNLRAAYELPTPEHHEGVYAYYFYRLIQRAKTVHMLYCSHADDKSTGEPSRYIYQLDYESGFDVRKVEVGVDVNLAETAPIEVPKDEGVMVRLERFVDAQSPATLSPTAFFRYVACPLRFYFHSIARLEADDEISEEVDAPMFGTILHAAVQTLYARIAGEADAPVCDVIFGGGVESLTAYERYFQPYACAEADLIRPGLRPADDLWTPFSSLPVVLIYNTKLVSPGELTGWESLLSGRWSGSIALADPTVSGSSYTAAATMLCALPGDDWDQLDRLAVQLEGRVLPDSGDVVAAVAGGSCRVGVTLEETALKRQAQGADIAIVYPEEGTSAVPDGSALIAGAPHPDNARAFLDFAQSRDVQELVVSQFSRRSVRTDVSDGDALPPADELALIDYPVRWAAELKDAFSARWPELLREDAPS